MGVEGGLAGGENHSADLAIRAEIQHPLHLGGQGQAAAAGAKGQDHRQTQPLGHLPGAGLVGAVYPVVKAHGPFHQGDILGLLSQGSQQALLPLEKQVQIPAGDPQHLSVKHGVNVIRPAFEALDPNSSCLEGCQQAAGEHSLSAAAGHGGDHQPLHGFHPKIKKTGFWARRR